MCVCVCSLYGTFSDVKEYFDKYFSEREKMMAGKMRKLVDDQEQIFSKSFLQDRLNILVGILIFLNRF